MQFINRKNEISILKSLKCPRIAVIGRRRVGKTTLVEHCYKNALTLYLPAEKTEKEIISDWINEYQSFNLPKVLTFKEFFEYLFLKEQDKVIFIDEFQNIEKVNRSFVYDLQRLLDKHKKAAVVVSGSCIALMKKIVEKYKSPLYGRFDYILRLKELDFSAVLKICKLLGYDFETTIKFYIVFGGIPKYYETLEKMGSPSFNDAIKRLFIEYPRPLNEEIRTMLKEEFGKEHKMFFSILTAVISGKNSLNEISNYTGRKQTELTKYLNLLREDFEILRREIPVTEKKSKRGLYYANQYIFSFWLYFIWRNYYLLERNLDNELVNYFEKEINIYFGRQFELLCRELLNKLIVDVFFPFKISSIGRLWGKNEQGILYEIDIAGVNRTTSEIFFAECKWSENVDSEQILSELQEKAAYVSWNKGKRKEYYIILAKTFKQKIIFPNVFLFDLADLELLTK